MQFIASSACSPPPTPTEQATTPPHVAASSLLTVERAQSSSPPSPLARPPPPPIMRSLQEHLIVPVDDTTGRREQLVYAPNEYVRMVPYAFSYVRMALYLLLLICSGGVLLIVSVWFPQVFTRIARIRLPFSCIGDAQYMLILVHEDGFRSTWVEMPVHRPLKKASGADKSGGASTTEVMTPSDDRAKLPWVWFEFKKHRYVFNHEKGEFERYLASINEDLDKIKARLDNGLDSFLASQKVELFGSNLVDIDAPHIPMLLFTKIVHPFYLFQVFSAIVWFYQDYTIYAIVILVLSATSMTWEIYSEVSNSNRLRSMVRSDSKVQVFRAGAASEAKMITLHETDLVPGDIIELTTGAVVADVLLLSGGCVVDEASLTGEAIPINKDAARGKSMVTDADARVQFKSSFLHAGSTVTRIRDASGPCKGVVLSTGFSTGKGELFRSIIFPRQITFEFERDSYRYLFVLVVIALAAFTKRVVDYGAEGRGFGYMLIHSLDLVTIAVPPALPLVLSSGIGFAMNRLHKAGIFCIDSQRINSCGQLDTFCFDKTGTLTEESLELVGVDVVSESKESFDRVSFEKLPEEFRMAMATCHGLSEVDGQLHGYSLELSMFNKAQVTLEFIHDRAKSMEYLAIATQNETTSHEKFGIVKRFHFDAACQRSSVIVENIETKQRYIFVKGSPEAIRAIAVDTPSDFKQKSLRYAAEGFYCIGFGMRKLAPGETIDTDSREAVEKDVAFMGITLFHNELKPESAGMIKELYDAAIDVRMITGDNALTAVHVARLLSMELKSKVAIVDLNESSEVVFHCVDEIRMAEKVQWELLTSGNLSRVMAQYDLAMTGAALEQLKNELSDESIKQLILETQIFARIRPTQKAWIVEKLMDYGKIVGMCGDGTNDCGALKAAHVGLALSSAEASIVAPFTSKAKDVTDVPVLIREGRCALTTSFLGFKFMVMYPVIQLAMASTLGHWGALLSNNQFIWDDLAIVLGMAMSMLYTASSTKLTKERPPNTLFSLSIVLSLAGQIVIFLGFYAVMLVILFNQSWFCKRSDGIDLATKYYETNMTTLPTLSSGFSQKVLENCMFYTDHMDDIEEAVDDIAVGHEISTTWLFAHMAYFSVALAFNLKDKFRLPFYTNYYFTGYFTASCGVAIWFLMDSTGTIDATFQSLPLTMDFRWIMFAMFVGNFVLAQVWELFATWVLPEWRVKRQEATQQAAKKQVNDGFSSLHAVGAGTGVDSHGPVATTTSQTKDEETVSPSQVSMASS